MLTEILPYCRDSVQNWVDASPSTKYCGHELYASKVDGRPPKIRIATEDKKAPIRDSGRPTLTMSSIETYPKDTVITDRIPNKSYRIQRRQHLAG